MVVFRRHILHGPIASFTPYPASFHRREHRVFRPSELRERAQLPARTGPISVSPPLGLRSEDRNNNLRAAPGGLGASGISCRNSSIDRGVMRVRSRQRMSRVIRLGCKIWGRGQKDEVAWMWRGYGQLSRKCSTATTVGQTCSAISCSGRSVDGKHVTREHIPNEGLYTWPLERRNTKEVVVVSVVKTAFGVPCGQTRRVRGHTCQTTSSAL